VICGTTCFTRRAQQPCYHTAVDCQDRAAFEQLCCSVPSCEGQQTSCLLCLRRSAFFTNRGRDSCTFRCTLEGCLAVSTVSMHARLAEVAGTAGDAKELK